MTHQTKQWSMAATTTVRRHTSTGATAGQGGSLYLYFGRYGHYDYDSFLKPTLDWTGVGRIVSAVLSVYTHDGLGDMPSSTTDTPYNVLRRLTDSFIEGNAPAGTWQSDDYSTGAGSSVHQHSFSVSRAELAATNLDITDIVEDWAPKTVKKRDGSAGGALTNYGLGMFGDSNTARNGAVVSRHWADASLRPYITLTYDYGITVPDTPASLAPAGSVFALDDFQGSFSDIKTTDRLARSQVQVYDAGHAGTGTASNNRVTSTAHGLTVGSIIYFTSLTAGTGLSTFTGYKVRTVVDANNFTVSTLTGTSDVDITVNYTALTWSRLLYDGTKTASQTEKDAARFVHVPDVLSTFKPNTTYRWRARVYDTEGQVSAYTALTSFSFQNTAPNAPTLTPASASAYASLDGVQFRGTFSDADAGDQMSAYQVQMSAYGSGDSHWDDDSFILWNSGKVYVPLTTDGFQTPYGGQDLTAGTYYWRARTFDARGAASDWTYNSIVLSSDFVANPADAPTAIQLRPRSPWRIVIRNMGANRGPGTVVAILEDATNVGASRLANSPGEAHWTLGLFHPQISVIEPKQTHYAIEFRQGDGWREVYAGLVWDFDATDTDVVFYGIDYLALLGQLVDEQYIPGSPDAAYNLGGSKYSNVAIRTIISDQLTKAKALSNSPVGFINVATVPAALSTPITVYSTYQPVLDFIVGLIDSYRAGSGKRTNISVQKQTNGTYSFVVVDDPGVARDNLRMRYGELVQGFRLVPFGDGWGTRVAAIGRDKDGIKVRYKTQTAPGISEATFGRFMIPQFFDGVSDDNDLARRARQFIVASAELGKQVGLGLRSGVLQPFDGYNLLDKFPVDIDYGPIDTSNFGHDGYWVAVGVTWQSLKQGQQNTTLTLQPMESGSAPTPDLLTSIPISTQAEWQVGWTAPTPSFIHQVYLAMDTGLLMDDVWLMDEAADLTSGRIYIDITTGKVYEYDLVNSVWNLISAPPTPAAPSDLSVETRITTTAAGVSVVNLSASVTP